MKKMSILMFVLLIGIFLYSCEKMPGEATEQAASSDMISLLNDDNGNAVCAVAYAADQGNKKNGDPVDDSRSDLLNANALDEAFFSLGFGGKIYLDLGDFYKGTVVMVWEETWGTTYPEEKAEVFVSTDGNDWKWIGTATNYAEGDDEKRTYTAIEVEDCIRYIKLLDRTDANLHGPTADGFDLNAVCMPDAEECKPCEPLETELWAAAGQNDLEKGSLVGKVSVTNDGDNLEVTYELNDGGCVLTEVHLWVGTDITEMPKNAAPGKFPFKDDEIDNQTSYTFTISLEDLEVECGENVFIAAHAVVCCEGWDGEDLDGIKEAMINVIPDPDPDPEPGEVTCETAWGFGDYTFIDEGISKNWGWVFEYTICCE